MIQQDIQPTILFHRDRLHRTSSPHPGHRLYTLLSFRQGFLGRSGTRGQDGRDRPSRGEDLWETVSDEWESGRPPRRVGDRDRNCSARSHNDALRSTLHRGYAEERPGSTPDGRSWQFAFCHRPSVSTEVFEAGAAAIVGIRGKVSCVTGGIQQKCRTG
jgi:hypothetical protein